jgi:hypothetical protein
MRTSCFGTKAAGAGTKTGGNRLQVNRGGYHQINTVTLLGE